MTLQPRGQIAVERTRRRTAPGPQHALDANTQVAIVERWPIRFERGAVDSRQVERVISAKPLQHPLERRYRIVRFHPERVQRAGIVEIANRASHLAESESSQQLAEHGRAAGLALEFDRQVAFEMRDQVDVGAGELRHIRGLNRLAIAPLLPEHRRQPGAGFHLLGVRDQRTQLGLGVLQSLFQQCRYRMEEAHVVSRRQARQDGAGDLRLPAPQCKPGTVQVKTRCVRNQALCFVDVPGAEPPAHRRLERQRIRMMRSHPLRDQRRRVTDGEFHFDLQCRELARAGADVLEQLASPPRVAALQDTAKERLPLLRVPARSTCSLGLYGSSLCWKSTAAQRLLQPGQIIGLTQHIVPASQSSPHSSCTLAAFPQLAQARCSSRCGQ